MATPGGSPDRGLSERQRISRSCEFLEAYRQNRKWVGRSMVLFLREGVDASLRLGVVAGKKVGKAHHRNRARRHLREAWRLNRHRFYGDVDVVLVARRGAVGTSFERIELELIRLARRAGIIQSPE